MSPLPWVRSGHTRMGETCSCHALPVPQQGCLCQMTEDCHQHPYTQSQPTFTQVFLCPDLWKQTDSLPALAARHEEMAWCSCFKHWEEHMGWFPTFLRGGCHCWAPRAHRSRLRTHSLFGCPPPHLVDFTLGRQAYQHPCCGWILRQRVGASHQTNMQLTESYSPSLPAVEHP